jgi:hypothetical protein
MNCASVLLRQATRAASSVAGIGSKRVRARRELHSLSRGRYSSIECTPSSSEPHTQAMPATILGLCDTCSEASRPRPSAFRL